MGGCREWALIAGKRRGDEGRGVSRQRVICLQETRDINVVSGKMKEE